MLVRRLRARAARLLVLWLCFPLLSFQSNPPAPHPPGEALTYSVEWRLITAGTAKLVWTPPRDEHPAQARLHLESTGLVSKLFKVIDDYTVQMQDGFCATSVHMQANEGRRHREARVTFDHAARKASYLERDVTKNSVVERKEIDIPACVHDAVSGLYRLRSMRVPAGQTVQIPTSDGKKFVAAKVEAQEREQIKLDKRTYNTIRYEIFLFNDVLYRRKGRLFVWLTDDDRRLPVQIKVRLQFHIGTITLQLEKEETS